MSSNIEHPTDPRPAVSGDAQLELVRRYARILRSTRAETTARAKRARTGAGAAQTKTRERPPTGR